MKKEILKNHTNEISIEIAGNEVASVREKDILKKGARVFKDNKVLSSSFVGDIPDEELVKNALANIEGAVPYNYKEPLISADIIKDITFEKQGQEKFYEDYKSSLEFLHKNYPQFIFSGKGNLSRVKQELIVDNNKLVLSYDCANWYFLYKHKKSPDMIDGYLGDASVVPYDIHSSCTKYTKYLDAYDSIGKIEEGSCPVVFVEPRQLLSKILESTRVDNYKKEIGVFKNKLGEKVLSDSFTLNDVSFDPSKGAVDMFDFEGYVRDQPLLPLIKCGVFENVICDLRNAEKYSSKLTGNARRSFDSSISLDYNSPRIQPGKRPFEEILKEFPKCIVVEMASGGDFTDEGIYSTPVQTGYLLENGLVKGRVPQITLISSLEKMFGDDLIEIAKDPFSTIDPNPAVFMNMKVLIN